MYKKVWKIFILIILLICYGYFLAEKIDLTTADLGRHLKNGEIAVRTVFRDKNTFDRLLKTNFYSYTEPDFQFVNHHWGSGVIFYYVWKFTGFSGLSILYILLSLLTFIIFLKLAIKNSNFTISVLSAFLLIPIIAERKEIRPEVFSYLITAIFFWILSNNPKNKFSNLQLMLLPVSGFMWANLHIYFIFGLFLVGVFLINEIISVSKRNGKRIKYLFLTFIFTALSFLIQPSGIKGALYPLNIFREYGYRIVENQSVWFLYKIGFIRNPNLLLYVIAASILLISFILVLTVNRREFSINLFLMGAVFGMMAFIAIRNFTLFGLFSMVILSYNLAKIYKIINFRKDINLAAVPVLSLIIVIFGIINNFRVIKNKEKGLGLVTGNSASSEFFKKENIKGPIFNNYDIGSFLIYYLFPDEKVFTDNRPETYSLDFFQKIYIPMQEEDNIWKEQDAKYNFSVIFFSHRDFTPWGQKFLVNRINDPNWAPVFTDRYAIIFLKRNDINQKIIEKYEIPRDRFRVSGIN